MPHPEDDPTIPDDAVLLRRVIPRWIVPEKKGGTRLSSAAFRDRTEGGMSVHLADEANEEEVLRGRPEDSLVSILAGQIRALGDYAIRRDPTEADPGHAVIFPTLSAGAGKKASVLAQWVVRKG